VGEVLRSKLSLNSRDEPHRPPSAPTPPPRSGFVQPCAAANGGIPLLLQSARLVAAVAELESLGGILQRVHKKGNGGVYRMA